MPGELTVIAGPARSGKTRRLLEHYRRTLAERFSSHPASSQSTGNSIENSISPQTLWLAPTHRSVVEIRSRLLSDALPACFNPAVMTFDSFAEAILDASPLAIRPMSDLVRREMIRHTIQEIHDAGRLKYFKPIAQTQGFFHLVSHFIRELKRLEIWPEDFERACRRRGMTEKDRDLLELYGQYQEAVSKAKLYDAQGRFWSARKLLREGQTKPFEHLKLLVLDGFTDLTRTQHEILEILVAVDFVHGGQSFGPVRLLVSLPLEAEPVRKDLFTKTIKTLKEFRRRHENITVETFNIHQLERPAQSTWPAMAHLEEQLFKSPRQQQQTDDASGIEILAAPGQLDEIQLVGARIKQLLTEGDASQTHGTIHVPAGDVAVVFRSLGEVAPLVREVFDEMGIPYSIETPPALNSSPAMLALVGLLELQEEDWPFRRLLGVLGNNYFQPDWPEWQGGLSGVAAEQIVRYLQIPCGCKRLLSQVKYRFESQDKSSPSDRSGLSEQPMEATSKPGSLKQLALPMMEEPLQAGSKETTGQAPDALGLLEKLSETLGRLPHKASPSQWAEAISGLSEETGLAAMIRSGDSVLKQEHEPTDPSRFSSRDSDAWQRFTKTLQMSQRVSQWLDRPTPEWTLSEMIKRTKEILGSEPLDPTEEDIGRVRVLSAPSVRSLQIPYLFVAGLSEKAFSPSGRQQNFYSEIETQQLIKAHLPLVERSEQSAEEMLLFYEVITRATRRLFLSYPAMDEKAQPASACPFLTDIERAFVPGTIARRQIDHLSPVPDQPEPQSLTDLRIQAVAAGLEKNTSLLGMLLNKNQTTPVGQNILAGLSVAHQRRQGKGFGPYEGILESEAAKSLLAGQYSQKAYWSASRLEQYALCPQSFFLEYVLKLKSPPELELEKNYLQRGRILHETLAEVHRALNRHQGGPASPSSLDEVKFQSELLKILEAVIADLPKYSDLEVSLQEINKKEIIEWTKAYLEQHRKYDEPFKRFECPPQPAHFEVSFGLPIGDNEKESLSTERPYEIALAGDHLFISGRIDRIDVGQIAGQTVFNIVDYKSGSTPKHKSMVDGTELQLELYAMAAQELILVKQGALPWQSGYWDVRKKGFKAQQLHEDQDDRLQPTHPWQERRGQIVKKLFSLVRGIRQGQFPMHSLDDDCTSRCPFRTVCRVNQVRALEKTWQAPS